LVVLEPEIFEHCVNYRASVVAVYIICKKAKSKIDGKMESNQSEVKNASWIPLAISSNS